MNALGMNYDKSLLGKLNHVSPNQDCLEKNQGQRNRKRPEEKLKGHWSFPSHLVASLVSLPGPEIEPTQYLQREIEDAV